MSRRIQFGCVACVAGTFVGASASALPILQVFTDTTITLNARVSDAGILPGVNNYPPLIGGVKWGINVSVRTFGAAGNDSLDILGTVEHIIPPPAPLHGEGPGPQFAFFMAFGSFGKPNGFYGFGDTGLVPLDHGDHQDLYRAFGTAEVAGGQIVNWHVDIRGDHTPTPGTAMLGTLGVLCAARRRRA